MTRVLGHYHPTDEDRKRIDPAMASWNGWDIVDPPTRRIFNDATRSVGYVRDLLDYSIEHNCRVVLADHDAFASPTLRSQLENCFKTCGAVASFRRDIDRFNRPLTDAQIRNSAPSAGINLVAVTPDWWKQHRNEYPDLLYGTDCWDSVMRYVVKDGGGKIFSYLTYHIKHPPACTRLVGFASELHNQAIYEAYMIKRGMIPYKDPNDRVVFDDI